MIAKATAALPKIRFTLENLDRYQPAEPVDLFFCNAVVQWLPIATRLKAITDLIRSQPSGGVFAFQAPDNLTEPSHEAMRDVAAQEPWATALAREPPGREPMETPREIYDVLGPYCSSIDIWHTSYQHVMESHEAIIEWVKGTGLRPFVDPLSGEERASFLAEYLRRLQSLYPVSKNGKVLFRFPRLFVVAVRH
jgi:trans-aconitate 2-methyltransferase